MGFYKSHHESVMLEDCMARTVANSASRPGFEWEGGSSRRFLCSIHRLG